MENKYVSFEVYTETSWVHIITYSVSNKTDFFCCGSFSSEKA